MDRYTQLCIILINKLLMRKNYVFSKILNNRVYRF